jgi:hypothetical protein
MGVDVDRHDVFDVGQLQLGHFRFSGRVQRLKLIISYNKWAKQRARQGGRVFPDRPCRPKGPKMAGSD